MNETHQARAPTVLRTGRPNREPLDTNEVIAYAIALAEQLGVSIPKRKKLYRTLKQKIPITQICQGAYYWLWIDRFYIAVQKLTDDSIRYVYLTRIHIRNEILADQRMPNPAASPAVSSTVGLKNMVIAPLTVDTEETLTYGELQLVAGAIEASITPQNSDPEVQYADDAEFDVLYPDPELSFKTKMADLPLIIQEMIFANKIDDNGVLIRSSTDKPPYFAVGFKSEKANHKYRYVWLYKVRAKPVTESYATKEGKSITRQTGEVEWTAIRRTHDNQYQAVADEGENGFTAEKVATFLESVYEPVFTSSP